MAYAAMEAMYALKVYHKLKEMPDLAKHMSSAEAVSGVKADIVPSRGSVAVMATRVAAGTILSPRVWENPLDGKRLKVTKTRRLLKVTEVYAGSILQSSWVEEGWARGVPRRLWRSAIHSSGTRVHACSARSMREGAHLGGRCLVSGDC